MAGSPDGNDRPDPGAAGTVAEFVDALRRLKKWSGLGFRRLESRAAAVGQVLPRSTITAALNREALPRQDLVAALVRSCGGGQDEVDQWVAAWRRIAAGTPPSASSSAGSLAPAASDVPTMASVPGPVRCTLPADQAVFVGRAKEIEQIATAVADSAQQGGVIAIDGMPGIGKTALAVHVAHKLAARFDDRQLFVDLHAHTPGQDPVQPGDALARLLIADGVDPRFLPSAMDDRASLWRDRMVGKRLLLILDNAASSEQILPLLPGASRCLILTTSRRSLGDLPSAVAVPLDVFTPDEAITMLARLAPHSAAHRDATADLVRACGYLPIAISIIASLHRRHRTWTIDDLYKEVCRAGDDLITLTAESRTVAAVFDLSCQHLPPDRQRFFRMLSLHPGIEIEPYAAASLTDTPLDEATTHLDELHRDHLLHETAHRRYRMHDLIRAHAHGLTVTTDPHDIRRQSIGRLLDYYQHTAAHADRHLARHTCPTGTEVKTPAAAPDVTTWEQAVTWLRTERLNLLACIDHAVATDQHLRTVGLTASIAGLLRTDGPWRQAAQLQATAASTARKSGDLHAYATAMTGLGSVRYLSGQYPASRNNYQQAMRIYKMIGDRYGHATALTGLGVVRWLTGNRLGAIALLNQALDLFNTLDDRRSQANAVLELAVSWRLTGNFPIAADLFNRAMASFEALGDRRGQANVLWGLGIIRRETGEYEAAAELLNQAFNLHRACGDQLGQAVSLHELGYLKSTTGDYPAAIDLLNRAIALFRTLGHRQSEEITSTRLAVVAYLTHDYTTATDLLNKALTFFREIAAEDDQPETLNHLAIVHRLTDRPHQALILHRQALTITRRIHARLEEARSLEGIGRAALQLHDPTTALTHLRQALDIYQQLGVPEATQVTSTLLTASL